MIPTDYRRPPRITESGNTLVLVLIVIAVLSLVAGNLMWSASARYHVTYQSASWQEALVAAEAGVDLAMVELRRHTLSPGTEFPPPPLGQPGAPGWYSAPPVAGNALAPAQADLRLLGGAIDPMSLARTTTVSDPSDPKGTSYSLQAHFPNFGHAMRPTLLHGAATHTGEGNSNLAVRVYVDVPGSGTYAANPNAPDSSLAQLPPSSPSLEFLTRADQTGAELDYESPGQLVNRSRWWWRIRSVGLAGVSGPPHASPDRRDNRLRRFSFVNDWRSGLAAQLPTGANGALENSPHVGRLVEVIAKPLTRMHFALLGDKGIDLQNQTVLIDSYDSTTGDYGSTLRTAPTAADNQNAGYTLPGSALDPNGKANPDVGKNVGWQGNIATNGQLINANGASVQGDASTNDGQVDQAQNVTGAQDPNFFQEVRPVDPPVWSNPTVVSDIFTDTTLQSSYATPPASTDSRNPTRLRLNGIDLTSSKSVNAITITPAAKNPSTGAAVPGFVQLYVQGDLLTAGANAIIVAPSVTLIVYVTGNVSLNGAGIANLSEEPSHLVINGVQPSGSTTNPSINIAPNTNPYKKGKSGGSGDDGEDGKGGKKPKDAPTGSTFQADFTGIVYAPNHRLTLDGSNSTSSQNDFAGAFIARTINVNARTLIHYDESLRNAGQVNGYKIVNWFEDTLTTVTP